MGRFDRGGKNPVQSAWDRFSRLPGGKRIFSFFLGRVAPYTGTIRPRVVEIRKGFARVQMKDRRGVRNHLNSIHAMALVNLGEVVTGVAMLYGLPDGARGIVTGFEIDYLKKARGLLTAECESPSVTSTVRAEYEVPGTIRDQAGDVVARVRAKWLIGPAKAE